MSATKQMLEIARLDLAIEVERVSAPTEIPSPRLAMAGVEIIRTAGD